ncbi:MAG: DUF1176 domain-containing protein [Rhodanobacteraceae bacterium]|nr:DUF1176 domain-containing protein [Rhodanobacteraceae bacterium]
MRTLVSLALLMASVAAPAQGYKEVKRWVAGCDNTRHCTAVGFAPADAGSYAFLHFERGGRGDDAVTRITLRVDHPLSREIYWILQADDAELLQFNDAHLVDADSGEGIDVVITDADEIAAMFGAMRGADTLTLVGDGGPVGTISLSGASAILLWIDEQQRRLGTTTAFVRKGEQPTSSIPVPPAPLQPRASAGGRALDEVETSRLGQLVRETLEGDECEEIDYDTLLRDSAFELADGRTLVQLVCYVAAYNSGSSWFLLSQGAQPQRIAFPLPRDDGSMTVDGDLVNADFDPATGVLSMFGKGRGIGDCGASGQWVWTEQGFDLVEYRRMGECAGVTPDYWPMLYRSAR